MVKPEITNLYPNGAEVGRNGKQGPSEQDH